MNQPIDEYFCRRVPELTPTEVAGEPGTVDAEAVLDLFDAQLRSRHLDFAARWLQTQGVGYYTIGSAGHEANAAVGQLTEVSDPALLHYRSGGFYSARALRHARMTNGDVAGAGIRPILLSLTAAEADPMSGGRHKVFGHPDLHIIPQTSTISSHLPRAVGLAFALGNLRAQMPADPESTESWPEDAIVVCSLGDASLNHSTAQGALNAAAYLAHRALDVPILFVCEDNGIGISTRTPAGWTQRSLSALPMDYFQAADARPDRLLADVAEAVARVREARRPAVLHLATVRFMGHAGSDVELAYRTRTEITADFERDPLLASARYLVEGGMLSPEQILARYEATRSEVMAQAADVVEEPRLSTRAAVTRPLLGRGRHAADRPDPSTRPDQLAPPTEPLTLSQAINAALAQALTERPNTVVFGEDVAVKGGVYGVTRGLRKRFGGHRVFDTLLDEQTILGTALGAALTGVLPIPEIQYLAYLHNAEDQVRGEAATLPFFSDGQYANPMVVRIAGLAYQKGFGGHFHNDNSVAVLRDIPGLVLCVPAHPQDAPGLLRECLRLAERDGKVCVFLEPIALYHTRDLHTAGDGGWLAAYDPGNEPDAELGSVRRYGTGRDLLLVTFGNGVPMSLRAAKELEQDGIRTSVLDLRWLAPLPTEALVAYAGGFDAVLVVDETRASGGVAESVIAALVDAGYRGALARVNSADSFVPLGPATDCVLLGEGEIVDRARKLVAEGSGRRDAPEGDAPDHLA